MTTTSFSSPSQYRPALRTLPSPPFPEHEATIAVLPASCCELPATRNERDAARFRTFGLGKMVPSQSRPPYGLAIQLRSCCSQATAQPEQTSAAKQPTSYSQAAIIQLIFSLAQHPSCQTRISSTVKPKTASPARFLLFYSRNYCADPL
jgi:hypothetical protein